MADYQFNIDDNEDLREALGALLSAAEAAGVSTDAMAGLLTVYLARLRGDVRLPLGMKPAHAQEFHDRAADHLQETMQVELIVTPSVLDEIDLQLRAFEPGEASATTTESPADDG